MNRIRILFCAHCGWVVRIDGGACSNRCGSCNEAGLKIMEFDQDEWNALERWFRTRTSEAGE